MFIFCKRPTSTTALLSNSLFDTRKKLQLVNETCLFQIYNGLVIINKAKMVKLMNERRESCYDQMFDDYYRNDTPPGETYMLCHGIEPWPWPLRSDIVKC